jgi:hypothetical protein
MDVVEGASVPVVLIRAAPGETKAALPGLAEHWETAE